METNYSSFRKRVDKATNLDDIKKLNKSLDRLWNAGIFTQAEFIKLDHLVMLKQDKLLDNN